MANVKDVEDKVFGRVSALKTMVENFPMDILDIHHGKTYNSAFEFLLEVLKSAGISTQEIILLLIEKIYGVDEETMDDMRSSSSENLQGKINKMDLHKLEESSFIRTIEDGVKEILAALLASVYTCSAVPILPDKVFDSSSFSKGDIPLMKDELKDKIDSREYSTRRNYPLNIPVNLIDTMGLLNLNPFSDEGLLYYDIEGANRYFKKEEVTRMVAEQVWIDRESEITVEEEVDKYEKNISIKMLPASEGTDSAFIESNWVFKASENVPKDIKIKVNFIPYYGGKTKMEWEGVIPSGTSDSNSTLTLIPASGNSGLAKTKSEILSILINNTEKGVIADNKTYVYLKGDIPAGWTSSQMTGVKWGDIPQEVKKVKKAITEPSMQTVEEMKTFLEYVECDSNEIPKGQQFTRVNYVPTYQDSAITESSPDYIVWFDGLSPNTLYRTSDLNAFIWFVLNKGIKQPYVEYNHMMWDSRISAAKEGVERKTDEEWNDWYNSKYPSDPSLPYPDGEFVTMEGESNYLFPIVQMERTSSVNLQLHIPSQRYYLPRKKKNLIDGKTIKQDYYYDNTSIYKFNRDYLKSIKIFRPKLLLTKMCEYLLGFAFSVVDSFKFDITKNLIQAKLSQAIKNVIEADDMQIEDCYNTFSNDEYNQLLEEMLMAKYKASYYGGETSVVRTHDVNDYISMLNSINASSDREGTVEKIKKLVTDITVDPGEEATIDYGIDAAFDGNILKKLLWGITEPIVESIFTPQVLLLFYINFSLTNVVKTDNVMGEDLTKMMNFTINKLFGLVKSIIIYIKDKIVKILLDLFKEVVKELINMWVALMAKEKIEQLKTLLQEMSECLRLMGPIRIPRIRGEKITAEIDDVDYADIVEDKEQNIPETEDSC